MSLDVSSVMQRNPLLRVAVVLLLGILAGDMWQGIAVWIWLTGAVLCLLLACVFRRPLVQTILIFLSCFALGGLFVSRCEQQLHANVKVLPYEATYEAVVASQPVVHGKVWQFDLLVTKVNGMTVSPLKVKTSLFRDTLPGAIQPVVGEGIEATSLLEVPHAYVPPKGRRTPQPGHFDYERWLQVHDYQAQTFIWIYDWTPKVISITTLSHWQRLCLRARCWQQTLLRHLADINNSLQLRDDQALAVVEAMTMGDKHGLSQDTRRLYADTGASHVLALSGLHLSIIYFVIMLFFPRRRWQTLVQVVTISTIWLYVMLTGMSPSVVRAALMLTLYGLVSLRQTDRMSLNTLAFSAIILLLFHPLSLWDISFQLSYLAVAGIVIVVPPVAQALKVCGVPRWLSALLNMLLVSLVAQLFTAPLVAYYFGRLSTMSLLTSLLAVPAATGIIWLTCLMLVSGPLVVVQKAVAWLLFSLASLFNVALRHVASWPCATVNVQVNEVQVVLLYVILGCFVGVVHIFLRRVEYHQVLAQMQKM